MLVREPWVITDFSTAAVHVLVHTATNCLSCPRPGDNSILSHSLTIVAVSTVKVDGGHDDASEVDVILLVVVAVAMQCFCRTKITHWRLIKANIVSGVSERTTRKGSLALELLCTVARPPSRKCGC